MLLLTSASDLIEVVTGTNGSNVEVHASWVDNASGTITPGRTNTAAITTNTTTTVVASPGASTQRNVKHLNITNTHATVGTQVTVQHTDGSNAQDLMGVMLLPGENLVFTEDGEWQHHDANGAEYSYSFSGVESSNAYGIAGTLAESIPRVIAGANLAALTSGTLFMQAIYLRAGQLVSNISFFSGTTAAGTPANSIFALYDANRNLLAQSANQTTLAWAASTVRTLAMTTPYRITVSGLYYCAILGTATTINSLVGVTAAAAAGFPGMVPILCGTSNTGLTTSVPNPANAITATVNRVWCAVT